MHVRVAVTRGYAVARGRPPSARVAARAPRGRPSMFLLLLPMFLLLLLLGNLPPGTAPAPAPLRATAPNTSLATIPAAYFGGHHAPCTGATGCRSAANLQVLAKMRMVMIEKWEGHCYDGCMRNASEGMPCFPSCNVEGDMLDTLARAKALARADGRDLTGVFYLNTLLAFPFYQLSGRFAEAGALLMDMFTGKPVELTNDENMQHVWVYDWGSAAGRQLFLSFIQTAIAGGHVDGMFADKWGYECKEVNASTWKICNNKCGFVTPAQAQAYNNGSIILREAVSKLLRIQANYSSSAEFGGLLYADGLSNGMKCPVSKNDENPDGSVKVNLVGRWALWRSGGCDGGKPGGCGGLSQKEVFETMARVKMYREECGFQYLFIGCGDHSNNAHWHNSTADPDDVDTDCSPNHVALFLLMVEEGMMIGANGWSADYDKPLGNPLGPATNITGPAGNTTALTRAFASGTRVTFDLATGTGHIAWASTSSSSDNGISSSSLKADDETSSSALKAMAAAAAAVAEQAHEDIPADLSPLLGYSADTNIGRAIISSAAAPSKSDTAALRSTGLPVVHVDCNSGSDIHGSGSMDAPLRSIQHALHTVHGSTAVRQDLRQDLRTKTVELTEGVCHLERPLRLSGPDTPPTVLRGRGPRSVLSGGKELVGWQPAVWPGAPAGSVFSVDIGGWPVEIKSLRHGAMLPARARWPKLDGDGLGAANWLFAQAWSTHPAGKVTAARQLHGLGLDPATLPPAHATNLSSLVGAYAHVLGCVEKDVNSQLTKVLSAGGTASKPTLGIEFRNSFTLYQRFYLENVCFALSPGEFFVDEAAHTLFYWPAAAAAAASASGESAATVTADNAAPEEVAAPVGVIAPIMDRLIEVNDSHHHHIQNLTFTDTTYYADGYWDGPAQQPSDAAIRISYADGVTVSGCQFLGSLGGYGVAVGNASTGTTITGSLFDSVGQGGVVAFGYDRSPVKASPGQQAGNNTQPIGLVISHNVMQDLGRHLIHVAGVAFRAASGSLVAHNRIHRTPRYGLQADSFYAEAPPNGNGQLGSGLVSRGNIFEYNILSETNRYTSDTGAIEMLGSGDPNLVGWWNNNSIRYNNISDTVGSSSSDGKNVCVNGVPATGCRRLVWGIYLDGGEAGITIHGNIIGATLHGAVFDNAGGNNTQTNNIFVSAGPNSPILMDFGAPGGGPRAVAGNTVQRNIFYWHGGRSSPARAMFGSMAGWSSDFLKPNGSDHNLFHGADGAESARTSKIFPGETNLSVWSGKIQLAQGPVTCTNTPGAGGAMTVSAAGCSWGFDHNQTSQLYVARKLRASLSDSYVIALDCEGSWANCDQGSVNTRICMEHYTGDWAPIVPGKNPGQVQNNAFNFSQQTGALVNEPNGRCVEVCERGGDVGGCNGQTGSIVQLRPCTGAPKQTWAYNASDGTFRSQLGTEQAPLCLAPPPRPPPDAFDVGSIAEDPLFVDAPNGDFSLKPGSPAVTKLGFVPIPPIEAPEAACGSGSRGGGGGASCLSFVL